MTYMPRLDAAMTADWPDLVAEFDRWGECGRTAALWWRDDDATTASSALSRLLRLAGGAPVALAVIPAFARAELADALGDAVPVALLQHGWRHANRAGPGKKTEYPDGRAPASVLDELAQGRARLIELFGSRALPVFVPPWNRFATGLQPLLVEAGITGLSTMASPRSSGRAPGLVAIDVHVDVTDWRGGRGFTGTAEALGRLIGWLRAHRLDPETSAGPIGVLTHHLVMDDATAAFLERLGAVVEDHAAARWTGIAEHLR